MDSTYAGRVPDRGGRRVAVWAVWLGRGLRDLVAVAGFAVAATSWGIVAGDAGHAVTCPCTGCGSSAFRLAGPGDGETATSAAFRLTSRWSRTASASSTGGQGSPITLTWGLVPDGTPIPGGQVSGESTDPSNLIANFDSRFGAGPGGSDLTLRPWFALFQSSFDRWSQLAGLTYIYEPNDDGSPMYVRTSGGGTSPGAAGQLGVRADIRIGGHRIDGGGNVLAYNFFPNSGEMVLDTSEGSAFNSSSNNFRSLRNIIMHEHGHGMGVLHSESNNSNHLMEPFLQTSFDGPQFDDILAAQRLYGDVWEKNGGNDTPATSGFLGTLLPGTVLSVGTSAGNTTVVTTSMSDFVSIDDESDVDFWRVSVVGPGAMGITLTPVGPTYNEGPQGGSQSPFNAAAQSDLTLALIAPDGLTELAFANNAGLGGIETLSNLLVLTGDYFVRVAGLTQDRIQMYRLDVSLISGVIPEPAGIGGTLLASAALLLRRKKGSDPVSG